MNKAQRLAIAAEIAPSVRAATRTAPVKTTSGRVVPIDEVTRRFRSLADLEVTVFPEGAHVDRGRCAICEKDAHVAVFDSARKRCVCVACFRKACPKRCAYDGCARGISTGAMAAGRVIMRKGRPWTCDGRECRLRRNREWHQAHLLEERAKSRARQARIRASSGGEAPSVARFRASHPDAYKEIRRRARAKWNASESGSLKRAAYAQTERAKLLEKERVKRYRNRVAAKRSEST